MPILALTVLDATGFEVSILTAAAWVGWVFLGLPAGVLVSRTPLRRLQVACDVARGVLLLTVPLAWLLDVLTIAQLLLVALVTSCLNVLFDVGNSTFLPAVVPRAELTQRNSLMSGTFAVTQTGGPALGGLAVTLLGAPFALLVDAASYLVSGAVLATLPEHRPPTMRAERMRSQIREGWSFVRSHPVMFPCMSWAVLINAASGALLVLVPTYLVRVLHLDAWLVGLLIATEGVGSVLGAWATPRLAARWGSARAMLVMSSVGGLFALLMPLAGGVAGLLLFGLGNLGFSAGVVVGSIVTRTHRQTESPEDLLARVMATVRFASWGAIPVGSLLAGWAITALGVYVAFWVCCVSTLAAPAYLATSTVRSLRSLSPETPTVPVRRADPSLAD